VIGLDTNIVVRMLAGDDPNQVAAIRTLLMGRSSESPAFISAVVLAETIWVLESRLGYPRPQVLSSVEQLLSSSELNIEHASRLADLLEQRDSDRIDLPDHLVAWSAEAAGCTHTATFDRRAAKAIPSMELLA
jgi:predicted nucleic-acid-binding protein